MKKPLFSLFVIIQVLLLPSHAYANLITNGDFESGAIGFTSEYAYSPADIWPEGTYAIVTDPYDLHALAHSFNDHTSGSGHMFAVNGSSVPGTIVWEETVSVIPNTTYDFAAYLATWQSTMYTIVPAELVFSINSSLLGDLTANTTPGVWDLFFTTWDSGSATSATIAIVDMNVSVGGNDFALDDMYFGAPIYSVPAPSIVSLLLMGVVPLAAGRIRQRNY